MAQDVLTMEVFRQELQETLQRELQNTKAQIVETLVEQLKYKRPTSNRPAIGPLRSTQRKTTISKENGRASATNGSPREMVKTESIRSATTDPMSFRLVSTCSEDMEDMESGSHYQGMLSAAANRKRALGTLSKQKRNSVLKEQLADVAPNISGQPSVHVDQVHGTRYSVLTGLPAKHLEKELQEVTLDLGESLLSSTASALQLVQSDPLDRSGGVHYVPPNTLRGYQHRLKHLVFSNTFVNLTAIVIFANVIFIGFGIDWEARHSTAAKEVPITFKIFNLAFFILFSIEIVLRILADDIHFFCGAQNLFDFSLVLIQSTEVLEDWHITNAGQGDAWVVLRILRILRMGRILRLTRAMHLFDELSNLLDSISSSMQSLVWVLIMVAFITYGVGVILTHIVSEYRATAPDVDEATTRKLNQLYGTVDRSMLVLYEVISQGTAWGKVMTPLTDNITPWISVIFVAYTAFVFFAMMNVVTSFFVDNTIRSVDQSRNTKMALQLWGMFKTDDGAPIEGITSEVFEMYLDTPEMTAYLASLDLTSEDTKQYGFFQLLDADGSGEIDADELVRGCLRLRGSAKQVDLCALMCMHRQDMNSMFELHEQTTGSLQKIEAWIQAQQATSTESVAQPQQATSTPSTAAATPPEK
eukprot:TRINITY_DN21957_c0_g1_i1.p1 TRINITY_DN21957_c0_g1~~TRINITY_DN21957_c0_g1_i1.p1  ORF type:complete len:644 (+),score=135.64 TRINITY_DN21957_c0_g1_i1:121-2052(+)